MNKVNFARYAHDNISYVIEDGEIQTLSILKNHQTDYFVGLQIIT